MEVQQTRVDYVYCTLFTTILLTMILHLRFQVLRVKTLVVCGQNVSVYGVLFWSLRSTSHTIRGKL